MQRSIRSTERACLTTVQRNALGLGPLPVLASHASHRDARDAWNAKPFNETSKAYEALEGLTGPRTNSLRADPTKRLHSM